MLYIGTILWLKDSGMGYSAYISHKLNMRENEVGLADKNKRSAAAPLVQLIRGGGEGGGGGGNHHSDVP